MDIGAANRLAYRCLVLLNDWISWRKDIVVYRAGLPN